MQHLVGVLPGLDEPAVGGRCLLGLAHLLVEPSEALVGHRMGPGRDVPSFSFLELPPLPVQIASPYGACPGRLLRTVPQVDRPVRLPFAPRSVTPNLVHDGPNPRFGQIRIRASPSNLVEETRKLLYTVTLDEVDAPAHQLPDGRLAVDASRVQAWLNDGIRDGYAQALRPGKETAGRTGSIESVRRVPELYQGPPNLPVLQAVLDATLHVTSAQESVPC